MEELTTGVVFRLATIKHTFPPDSEKLHVLHLELSENDKRQAAERGAPALLSVFDAARTTVSQAEAIRGVPEESLAFGLRVPEVGSLTVPGMRQPLRIVRDPLEPPLSAMPGAEGHCGIEGLERLPGEDRKIYRELRVRLADLSWRYKVLAP
ncbi:MAG TPA: hypothetical protein VFR31_17620 [Thermoanaerobaculia bacterium]|nr:hypothetical protein [Thermoanaerobaculia bacterium]